MGKHRFILCLAVDASSLCVMLVSYCVNELCAGPVGRRRTVQYVVGAPVTYVWVAIEHVGQVAVWV